MSYFSSSFETFFQNDDNLSELFLKRFENKTYRFILNYFEKKSAYIVGHVNRLRVCDQTLTK